MKSEETIRKLIEEYNVPIIEEKKDYYYSKDKNDRELTFEKHLKEYGYLAKIGKPANRAVIDAYGEIIGQTLPQELIEFYMTFGSIGVPERGRIASVDFFVNRMQKPESFKPYDRLKSCGIVDFIVHAWGGHRAELEPDKSYPNAWCGPIITQEEADYLNQHYFAVGNYLPGESILEAAHYIYFDKNGHFGTVYYHQDEPGELRKDFEPMLSASKVNNKSLSEFIIFALEECIEYEAELRRLNEEDEDEEDDE